MLPVLRGARAMSTSEPGRLREAEELAEELFAAAEETGEEAAE